MHAKVKIDSRIVFKQRLNYAISRKRSTQHDLNIEQRNAGVVVIENQTK